MNIGLAFFTAVIILLLLAYFALMFAYVTRRNKP